MIGWVKKWQRATFCVKLLALYLTYICIHCHDKKNFNFFKRSLSWTSPPSRPLYSLYIADATCLISFPDNKRNFIQCSILGAMPSVSTPDKHVAPIWRLPWWLSGKESTCQAGDVGSIPGLGRFPEEVNGNSLLYFCLENPMDRGTW